MQNKKTPRKNKKYVIGILFLLILMFVTYYFVFRAYSFNQLLDVLKEVDIKWILLSVAFVIIFVAGQGISIRLICKSLGHKISLPSSFVYSSIDFYYSGITPSATGGQPMMAYYMAKDGVPLSKCGIALVLTVMQYTLSIVVLGIAGAFILPDFISHATSHPLFVIFYFLGMLLNLALVLACVAAMFWRSLVSKFIVFFANFFYKIKIVKDKDSVINNLNNVLMDYNDAAHYFKNNPLIVLKVFFINLFQRIAQFSISYFVYRSFGFSNANFFSDCCSSGDGNYFSFNITASGCCRSL